VGRGGGLESVYGQFIEYDGPWRPKAAVLRRYTLPVRSLVGGPLFSARPQHGASPILSRRTGSPERLARTVVGLRRDNARKCKAAGLLSAAVCLLSCADISACYGWRCSPPPCSPPPCAAAAWGALWAAPLCAAAAWGPLLWLERPGAGPCPRLAAYARPPRFSRAPL
jgi:hypothetical protein